MGGEEKMKFYQTNWFLRISAVVIAVILWIYVVYVENPSYETWVRGIPVTYTNMVQEFEDGKLMLVETDDDTIDIKIRGRRRLISGIYNTEMVAMVDMLGITREGTYSLPVNINFGSDGIEILEKKPYNVQLTVDRVVSEQRDIEVNSKGSMRAGFVLGESTSSPATITLTGPKSLLERVAHCAITVDFSDVAQDVKGLYKIKLYDASNNEVTDERIIKNVEYTDVYYEVLPTKILTVKPALTEQTNANGNTIEATVVPERVTVKGDAQILADITEIFTVPIEVSGVREAVTAQVGLELPEGVAFADDAISSTVTVSLQVK
ncbi:MAG: hypothetical protein E7409_04010 [Ruminococcaceae bacterium]|nr:hypothetical protein [Oscillospiraceae bacterium]